MVVVRMLVLGRFLRADSSFWGWLFLQFLRTFAPPIEVMGTLIEEGATFCKGKKMSTPRKEIYY
jgi:hypothetical protein